MPTLSALPLFPLGTVLFPDGRLALRVFEPRYLDMVGRCHRTGAPFGVVALAEGGEVRVAGAPPERLEPIGPAGGLFSQSERWLSRSKTNRRSISC